ncbi:MAG: hypothetical protein HOV97_05390 [Nonomuraea sp.]|nr:hypothetical protein [Nonomuraea sp.]
MIGWFQLGAYAGAALMGCVVVIALACAALYGIGLAIGFIVVLTADGIRKFLNWRYDRREARS